MSDHSRTLDERWQRNQEASLKRLGLKERAVAYLGGSCVLCGYNKCPSAFDFHHVDALEKDFVISGQTSWEAVEPELNKCALLCANCHREVHAGWHPQFLAHEEERGGSLWEEGEVTQNTPLTDEQVS